MEERLSRFFITLCAFIALNGIITSSAKATSSFSSSDNSFENIAQMYMVTPEEINYCLLQVENILNKNFSQIHTQHNENKDITRITLHVSNDCNLRCKYCYAHGGNYNMQLGYMNVSTAEQFVDFCIYTFNYIDKIVFFGGEPCLNIEIMECVCRKFERYYLDKKIQSMPKFVIITNGTILNTKLLELIKSYISYITVSIDGEESLNDFNRIDIQGNGSYKKVAHFIDTIKQQTDVHIQYEATYTNYHIERQISKADIRNFLKKRFGIPGIIVNEENIKYQNKIDDLDTSTEKMNCDNLPVCFYHILQSISLKQSLGFCPIAIKQFAISTTGEIFPCHMDVGNSNLSLGNIFGSNIFNDSNIHNSFPLYDSIYKKDFQCCKICWAQNLCESCSRLLFYNQQTKTYNKEPNPNVCKRLKENIEKSLILITRLRKDKSQWQYFVQKSII